MAQDIVIAMVIAVPVVLAAWTVIANAIGERRAYKDSLKGN